MLKKAVNWNKIEDPIDLDVWNRLVNNFWVPERVPVSNDVPSWSKLSDLDKDITMKVFTGLTLLDTIQGTVGAVSLIPDALTPHEEAVYTNVSFMESVHAKSYSTIFSTLADTERIDGAFAWSEENKYLQTKAQIVTDFYDGIDPFKKKIASTFLESFLFYSGFYWPFYLSAHGKLTNSADIIRLIVRDECMTSDHDLLTPQGWKAISKITVEDTVAQYDKDTGEIQFVNPVKTSSSIAPHTWDFETHQGHIRQSVSPNHRMLLERRPYGKTSDTAKDYLPEVVKADDLSTTRLNGYSRFINAGLKTGGRDHLTAKERLLIAISADGSFDTTTLNAAGQPRRNGSVSGFVPCRIAFSKERKISRLLYLAKEAGVRYVESAPRSGHGNVKDRRQFTLYLPADWDRSKRLGAISDLSDVSSTWCNEFIQELAEWDGYRVPDSDGRITWGSVVPENADFVQAVCALAGVRTHRTVRPDDRSDTFSDYHRIQINSSPYTGAQRVIKTRGPARAVYGVEVPSGFLVTRNGGSVTITGNSVHGYYIGYKFQKMQEVLTQSEKDDLAESAFDLLFTLYNNEMKYTEDIYHGSEVTDDVKRFLKYNANKALMNLGYDALFSREETAVSAAVMSALSPDGNENHDFFSGSGSSYVIGKVEELDEEDWDY